MDDSEFENFWFTLKRNMLNFYNNNTKINKWSYELNALKNYKQYDAIQLNILSYMNEMMQDIINNHPDLPLCYIFQSNIKRWIKIVKKTNFLNSLTSYNKDITLLKNKFELYVKIRKVTNINDFNLYYTNGEFNIDNILELGNKYISVVNSLVLIYDIPLHIEQSRNIKVDYNIKPKKLIKLINTQ